MNLSEIRNEVVDLIQVLTRMPDYNVADVDKLINRGYRDFVRKAELRPAKTVDVTVTPGKQWYSITDIPSLRQIIDVINVQYILAGESDNGYWLRPMPVSKVPKYSTEGIPRFYILRRPANSVINDFEIGLYPVPNDAGKLIIDGYIRLQDELTLDDDSPDEIPDEYHEALIYYAAWRMFLKYSHRSKEFYAKAREMERLYKAIVQQAAFDSTFSLQNFPEIDFDF